MAKNAKKIKELPPEYLQVLSEGPDLTENSRFLLEKYETFKECERSSLEKLLKEVKKSFTTDIVSLISCKEDPNDACLLKTKAFIALILKMIAETDIVTSYVVQSCAAFLSGILTSPIENTDLKSEVSKVCEHVLGLSNISEDFIIVGVLCLQLLFDIAFKEEKRSVTPEIKRIWGIHKVINEINIFNPTYKPLVDQLTRTVTNKNFLMCKEGRQVIGVFMARDPEFVKLCHAIIINTLPKVSKPLAARYGDVYHSAWCYAVPEIKTVIEDRCIQDIMARVFSINRIGMEMSKTGQIAFSLLSQLHTLRKNQAFSSKLTELYSPLIWRHLRSGNPYERCNAAEIFIDVFPLEKSNKLGAMDAVTLKERQFKELHDLLTDDCHIVRLIGIKGVCRHLMQSLEVFCLNDIRGFIKVLVEKCANDGSTWLVRRAVFEGFEKMLGKEESAVLLKTVLPQLTLHVHDEHEKVRKAFVQMLLKVKESPHVDVKYWDIVPLDQLITRLQLEGQVVGELIVKLLMSNFYTKEKSMETVISRLFRFIEDYPGAGTKLFKFSKKVIDVEDAFKTYLLDALDRLNQALCDSRQTILRQLVQLKDEIKSACQENVLLMEDFRGTLMEIQTCLPVACKCDSALIWAVVTAELLKIVVAILTALKNKLNKVKEYHNANENTDPSVPKKKKKKVSPLSEISNVISEEENRASIRSPNSSSSCDDNEEEAFLEKHKEIKEMIDCISTLCLIFQDGFKERKDIQEAIHMVGSTLIPILLKYYKGTPVFYTVIVFSSLIPLSVLNPCVPIASICMSELKMMTENTPKEEIECLVYSLCLWNRGSEVLDLATEWIDHAFRIQNLNSTAVPKPGKRQVKVRFVPTVGKPLLALKMLDVLFNNAVAEKRLLDKSYNQAYDFFVNLERVKVLIEMRSLKGVKFDEEELSDEFLHACFERYLSLILILHRPDQAPESVSFISNEIQLQPVDASYLIKEIIGWSEFLMKDLPEEVDVESPLAVKCLNSILNHGNMLLSIMKCDKDTALCIALMARELMDKDSFVWFLDECVKCLTELTFHSLVYTPNDEWGVFKTVVPLMLQSILSSIAELQINADHLPIIFPSVPALRNNIFSILKYNLTFYGDNSLPFKKLLGIFLDSCCAMIQKEINRMDAVDKHNSIDEYPCMVGIIMKTILLKPVLCKYMLSSIKLSLKESEHLPAYVSLLHTLFSSYKKKLSMPELRDVVLVLQCELRKKYPKKKNVEGENVSLEDSFMNVSLRDIGIYQTAEPLIEELMEGTISDAM